MRFHPPPQVGGSAQLGVRAVNKMHKRFKIILKKACGKEAIDEYLVLFLYMDASISYGYSMEY